MKRLVCLPLLLAALLSAAQDPGSFFSIKPNLPPQIASVTQQLSFTISATDLKKTRRNVAFLNELVNARGEAVWHDEGRLDFSTKRTVDANVFIFLPALPPGPYELVSRIPDVTFPEAPEKAARGLTFGSEEVAPPPLAGDKPGEDRHTLVVRTPLRVVPYIPPDLTPKEPFVVRVLAPDTLPPGPSILPATVTVTRVLSAPGSLFLQAAFVDDLGRAFWQEKRPLPADLSRPASFAFSIPLPALPAGQFFVEAAVRDGTGKTVGPDLPPFSASLAAWFMPKGSPPVPAGAVRKPVARLERFAFDRDLLWGTWDQGDLTPEESDGVKKAGINVGRRGNYAFRHRWFVDHAPLQSTGLWPEDALRARKESGLEHYRNWMGWARNDPGFVVMDMYDELAFREKDDPERNRLNRLMYDRNREAFPGVSTITKWNAQMGTDALGWDEVLREGFPEPSGTNAVKLKWAFQACINDLVRLRMQAVRELNPCAQLTPGMGAGLLDPFYDSMHNRAYNKYSTLAVFGLFTAGIPQYGNTPWSWLINLKPPFEQCSRITWAALASAGRFFPVYCPGDGYGDRISDPAGNLTPSGEMIKSIIARIQPLAPVLLGTRNRIRPEVLYYHPVWAPLDNGLFEGLLACGVQPDCGTNTAGRRLLVLQATTGAQDSNAVFQAVAAGAGLVLTPDATPAVARAFGLNLPPAPASRKGLPPSTEELDLSALKDPFPGFDGLRLRGVPGPGGTLMPGSPLRPVQSGGRTLAWTGQVGKGWVLALNARIPTNRPANAAFMRALLDKAGVDEAFRFTDDAGRFHPGILGSVIETADRSQSYVIAVTESQADVQSRFRVTDPAVVAVRDLCAGNTLDWKRDAAGRYIEVNLPKGVGTILSLLKDLPGGPLQVQAPASVQGGQTLSLALSRLGPAGKPLAPAHTYRVRILGPDAQERPGLTAWGTGPAPLTISRPVAVSDPAGAWAVEATDLTDGSTASTRLVKSDFSEPPPARPPGPEPAADPFRLVLDPVPPLEGDVCLVTLKGSVSTTLAAAPEVIVEPAVPESCLLEGTAKALLHPTPGAPAAFAFTYCLPREEAQALRGGRSQGVAVRLSAAGHQPVEARWIPPVNPFTRAPQRLATVSGGTVSLRVDNFTDRPREVTLSFGPGPGWADGRKTATKNVPAATTARFDWPVTWNDPLALDPGLSWLPLQASVDGASFPAGKVFLEQDLEQEWWIGLLEMKPGEEADWDPCAVPGLAPAEAARNGWQRVTTQTVLWWPSLVTRLIRDKQQPPSQMAAVTHVRSATARKVRLGYVGPTAPERILLNGHVVEADWKGLANTGGIRSEPVELRAGLNTVAVEVLLPVGEEAATSLVIQDPATGRRDRTLALTLTESTP